MNGSSFTEIWPYFLFCRTTKWGWSTLPSTRLYRRVLIEVMERDEAGSVPELKVINKSSCMILVLEGEELVGAKQNRIVNTTILIQGKATTVIPVSCVEQGRWAYESRAFGSEERLMAESARRRGSRSNSSNRKQG